jgi:hypothetical protein
VFLSPCCANLCGGGLVLTRFGCGSGVLGLASCGASCCSVWAISLCWRLCCFAIPPSLVITLHITLDNVSQTGKQYAPMSALFGSHTRRTSTRRPARPSHCSASSRRTPLSPPPTAPSALNRTACCSSTLQRPEAGEDVAATRTACATSAAAASAMLPVSVSLEVTQPDTYASCASGPACRMADNAAGPGATPADQDKMRQRPTATEAHLHVHVYNLRVSAKLCPEFLEQALQLQNMTAAAGAPGERAQRSSTLQTRLAASGGSLEM